VKPEFEKFISENSDSVYLLCAFLAPIILSFVIVLIGVCLDLEDVPDLVVIACFCTPLAPTIYAINKLKTHFVGKLLILMTAISVTFYSYIWWGLLFSENMKGIYSP
jgi:predicted permease